VLNKDRDLALALVISEIERLEVTLILIFLLIISMLHIKHIVEQI